MTIKEMNERRRELGYSYRQLSELAGLPLSTVQKVFGGYTKFPRRETVEKLERVLAETPVREELPAREKPLSSASLRKPSSPYVWPPERPFTYEAVSELGGYRGMLRDPGVAYGAVRSEKRQGEYTIDDYLAVPDDRRVELIDGVIYDMAAPKIIHQELLMELSFQLRAFVKKNGGPCRVLPAPHDVQLDRDDRTMVQPDVSVICHREDIAPERMHGAPDLVIEILSPSNSYMDLGLKYEKYLRAGVREYWVVDPERFRVIVNFFSEGRSVAQIYTFKEKIPVGIWDGRCEIDLSDLAEELAYLLSDEATDTCP